MEEKSRRGGRRNGAGRKRTGNDIAITVRLTRENKAWLDNVPNKTRWFNEIIEREREGL